MTKINTEILDLSASGMTLKDAKRNIANQLRKKYPQGFIIVNNLGEEQIQSPFKATQCSTADQTAEGTKKWITKYKLIIKRSSGEVITYHESFDTQGPALKKAREIVLQEQCMVALQVTKQLEKGSDNLKIITPKGAKLGKWHFTLEVNYKE